MRYSDVAEKYYKDTKNRILQNVLAAEENGSERSQDIIIGEKENKERIIMTNGEVRKSTAKIRNNKGMIAAACAIVMIGSGAFAMNTFRSADSKDISSRPDNMKEVVATTSNEDSSYNEQKDDTEAETDTKTDDDTKTEEKKEDISRAEVKEKKTDSSIADVKEKTTVNNRTEVNENTAVTADNNDNNTQTNEISDENDRGRHAEAGKDFEGYSEEDNRELPYDNVDIYVSPDLSDLLEDATTVFDGTITSVELYGRTRDEQFKPLSEYSESELENVGRLYFRCKVTADGQVFKNPDWWLFKNFRYLSDRDYDHSTNTMIVNIPVPKKPTGAEIEDIYASNVNEINDPDLYKTGDKLLITYWSDSSHLTYKYDYDDHRYHESSYYVPNSSIDEDLDYESMTNYALRSFIGNDSWSAERWVNFLGENYTIKNEPSRKYSSGQVLDIRYSLPDNGYVIYVAE